MRAFAVEAIRSSMELWNAWPVPQYTDASRASVRPYLVADARAVIFFATTQALRVRGERLFRRLNRATETSRPSKADSLQQRFPATRKRREDHRRSPFVRGQRTHGADKCGPT